MLHRNDFFLFRMNMLGKRLPQRLKLGNIFWSALLDERRSLDSPIKIKKLRLVGGQ